MIEADIHQGSRHDALLYAAKSAAAERGFSVDAALAAIRQRSQGRRRERP